MQGRLQTLPLCESSRDDVIDSITRFLSPRNYSKVSLVIDFLSSSCWLIKYAEHGMAAMINWLAGLNLSYH